MLSDGLPLFGDVGGLGLLQIPPMDLGQVEVIKGVASALYGAGAMGGVVNLLSRRPDAEPEREFLFNRSTRGATDAVSFLSAPLSQRLERVAARAAGTGSRSSDVNDDAWADLPDTRARSCGRGCSGTTATGGTFFATAGVTYEDRDGGTPTGAVLPRPVRPTSKRSRRGGRRRRVRAVPASSGRYVVTARAAVARQSHDHQFGEVLERDRHDTAFGEVAIRGAAGRHTWVGGLAVRARSRTRRGTCRGSITRSRCRARSRSTTSNLTPALSLSASGRARLPQRVRHVLQSAPVGS